MEVYKSAELFTAINLLVIGASHFFQPKAWTEFFIYLQSKKQAGNIFNALLSLGTGSLILSFHFIWEGAALVVTVFGLLQTLKGSLYLISTALGIRSISRVNHENAGSFRIVGGVMMVVSFFVFYIIMA